MKINDQIHYFNKKDFFVIIAIFLYALLQFIQTDLVPLLRYPHWDAFWVDTINYGQISIIKKAIMSMEIPSIHFFTNFGMSFSGEAANPVSIFNPIHWMILLFSPEVVIQARTFFLLLIGISGCYLYIEEITHNKIFSFFIATLYISLPETIISLLYGTLYMSFVYFSPGFLFLIHKILSTDSRRFLLYFYMFSLLSVVNMNSYGFVSFPVIICVYSLIISAFYFKRNYYESILFSFKLILIWTLSSSIYLLPFLENVNSNSLKLDEIINAGIYAKSVISLSLLYTFFMKNLAASFFFPNNGVYYIPWFMYLTVFFSLIFKRYFFSGRYMSLFWPFLSILILLIFLFLEGITIHAIPIIAAKTPSYVRLQTYLFPFLMLIASSIANYALINSYVKTKYDKGAKTFLYIYFLLLILLFILELFIFNTLNAEYINKFTNVFQEHLYSLIHPRLHLPSINYIDPPLLNNVWYLFSFSHLIIIFFIFLFALSKNSYKKYKFMGYISMAGITSLVIFSINNQLKNVHKVWDWQTKSSHLKEGFIERHACVNSITDRGISFSQLNYRTLYTGLDNGSGRALDWKLIAETEVHPYWGEKVIFPYREVVSPYVGLLWSAFTQGKGFRITNYFPPVYSNVQNLISLARFMGAKYIISADTEIQSNEVQYKGSCTSNNIGPLKKEEEIGTFYAYELKNPSGIVYYVDNYVVSDIKSILQLIYKDFKNFKYDDFLYLEEEPSNFKAFKHQKNVPHKDSVKINKESFNNINIESHSTKNRFLVLSYEYSPKWAAYIDGEPQKIYRAYGGFMAIKIPIGTHDVKFIYNDYLVYISIFLSILPLICFVFYYFMIHRRTQFK